VRVYKCDAGRDIIIRIFSLFFFVKIQKKKRSREINTCETFEKSKEKKRSEAQRRPQKRMKRKRNARCYYRSSLISSSVVVFVAKEEEGVFLSLRSFLRIFCFDFASLFSLSLCRGRNFKKQRERAKCYLYPPPPPLRPGTRRTARGEEEDGRGTF